MMEFIGNLEDSDNYHMTQDFNSIPNLPGVRVWVGKSLESEGCFYHLWFHNDRWYKCEWGKEQDDRLIEATDFNYFKNISRECFDGWFTWLHLEDKSIFG